MEQEDWEKTYMGSTFRVNLPQLEVSITYLCINAVLTRMHVEREWLIFGRQLKTLRVSHPKGEQRSTYRLQLPYRWSIPLMIISGTLHWLISNCIYPQSYISEFYLLACKPAVRFLFSNTKSRLLSPLPLRPL